MSMTNPAEMETQAISAAFSPAVVCSAIGPNRCPNTTNAATATTSTAVTARIFSFMGFPSWVSSRRVGRRGRVFPK